MSQRAHTEDIAGRDLRFETLGPGPEDDMPQAIRVIDPEARSAIYRPLMNDGRSKPCCSRYATMSPVPSRRPSI
jgi:hypothetical protein